MVTDRSVLNLLSQHVMKFAELTQDVQVARGQEVQFDENVLQPGRRKQNLLYKRVSAGGAGEPLGDITNRNSFGFNLPAVPPAFCMPPFPTWTVSSYCSLVSFLEAGGM